jgi:hypothetical protein
MNAQNAHEYLPLVQALANGLTIQFLEAATNKWVDQESPSFEYDPKYYRIKPEPRTFEIVVSKLSRGIYDARDWHGTLPDDGDPQWEHVTVMEVLK